MGTLWCGFFSRTFLRRKPGERVEHRELEVLFGQHVFPGRDVDLIRKAAARASQLHLLVQCVNAEQHDEADERAYRLVDVELVERIVRVRNHLQGKRRDRDGERDDYDDSQDPQGPVASPELL